MADIVAFLIGSVRSKALMFHGRDLEAGVSSFQALAMSLSARVGTGNIAGEATATVHTPPGQPLSPHAGPGP